MFVYPPLNFFFFFFFGVVDYIYKIMMFIYFILIFFDFIYYTLFPFLCLYIDKE